MSAKLQKQSVFEFDDYRKYLAAIIDQLIATGQSYRAIAKSFHIKSPNYLQQVLAHQRNLTPEIAGRMSKWIGMTAKEEKFFVCLVKLAHPQVKSKDSVLIQMRALATENQKKKVKDDSIHRYWINGLILELALIKGFALTPSSIREKIGHIASEKEVKESLDYLVAKKFLLPSEEPNVYKQGDLVFESLDDVRRIDLQRSHLRYLDIAKHKINDDLDHREYRGLTIAIQKSDMPKIKAKLREFYKELRLELEGTENPDKIVRLQTCLFELTLD
ncbi:MAG: TIGR02147 family protein [Oligoflexales bacterium]